jgi:hypothetical protein
MEDRKIKRVLLGDGYLWKGVGHKKGVKEGEYGGCILYSCMKIEQRNLLKLFYENGEMR